MSIANEVRSALQDVLKSQEPLVLSPHGLPISFFVALEKITDEGIYLKNPIPFYLLPYVLTAKSFSLHWGNFRFQSQFLIPDGSLIVFRGDESAQQGVARQMDRVSYYNANDAFVRIKHPFDIKTELQRPLYDLSQEGLSFRARLMTPFIQPGREIPECEIYVHGKKLAHSSGKIVYVKQIYDLQGQNFYQVGMQLSQSIEVRT